MIRILIADDHVVVREGLKRILAEQQDMIVTGEVSSGREVLDFIANVGERPNIILLDVSMPDTNCLALLKELRAVAPYSSVLILSMMPEGQYAIRLLRAGACGYVSKASESEQLIQAIRKVRGGGKYISPALAERLAFDLDMDSDRPPHEALSDREFQVLCMIASGKSLKEIAGELSLSAKTISTFRSRVLDKLKCGTNAELIVYAIQYRLIPTVVNGSTDYSLPGNEHV